MSTPTLFVDRDGTLIEEPPDNQVDDLRKVRFLPGVVRGALGADASGLSPGDGHEPGRPRDRALPACRLRGVSRLRARDLSIPERAV